MAVLPYDPTLNDAGPLPSAQLTITPILDDIDCFVDVNDLAAGPAVGAAFTMLLGGLVPEACARCLSITYFVANSGTARGITLLVRGRNGFGVNVSDFVVFAAKAANTTNITFTRNAYSHVASVTYISRSGGAVVATDRVDVGLAWLAGTAAGTHDAANGSAATDYKTVGCALPVSVSDGFGAVDQADFPVQVSGHVWAEDGTSGVTTKAIMSRAGDFGIDTAFQTLRMDEEFVLAGTGNHGALVRFTPNRGASQSWGAIDFDTAPLGVTL